MADVREGGYVVAGWFLGSLNEERLRLARETLVAAGAEWIVVANGSDAANDAVLGIPVVVAEGAFFEEGGGPESADACAVTGEAILATKKKATSAALSLEPVFAACREAGLKVGSSIGLWLVGVGAETWAQLTDGERKYTNGPHSFGATELKLKGLKGKTYPLVVWARPLG